MKKDKKRTYIANENNSESEQLTDRVAKSGLSRRDFIKGAAAGAAGLAALGVLGACRGQEAGDTTADNQTSAAAPSGETAGTTTTAAAETIPVTKASEDWLDKDNGMFDWRVKPEAPSEFAETLSADVIVCGAGLAGLSAARRAAELGSTVIVLEKDDTYDIHGFQCASFNPSMLKNVGVEEDEVEFFNSYMMTHGNRCNPDIIRLWMKESGPAFDWYEEIMPPQGEDYLTDYRSVLYWPRPEGYTSEGMQYKNFLGTIDFTYESWANAGSLLYKKTEELGVTYRCQESGYMLIKEDERVTGIISKVENGEEDAVYNKYEAAKGVIISTGYHGTATDIMKEIGVEESLYTLRNGEELPTFSGFGGSGDGHRMLVWEGAEIEPFRQADGTCLALLDPAAGFSVNVLGKRWHNEDVPCWSLGLEMRWQPQKKAWKVYDKNWRECLPYQAMSHMAIDCTAKTPWTVPPKDKYTLADGVTMTDGDTSALDYLEQEILAGVGNKDGFEVGSYWSWPGEERYAAETLEELAEMMGFTESETETFLAEIEEYNQICENKKDTRYGKAPTLLFPIKEGPFFASSTTASSIGRMGQEGIMTNNRLQPIIPDEIHTPIEGVYLAGVLVGGRHANQYMTPLSGMNHGFCVTFGKLAAEFLEEDNQ